MASCPHQNDVLDFLVKYSNLFSYIIIITRDLMTTCVMVYFIVKVNRRESNI